MFNVYVCVTRARSVDVVKQQRVLATHLCASVSLACYPHGVMSFGLAAFFPSSCGIHRFHMSALEAFMRRVAAPSVVLSECESQLVAKLCEALKAFSAD